MPNFYSCTNRNGIMTCALRVYEVRIDRSSATLPVQLPISLHTAWGFDSDGHEKAEKEYLDTILQILTILYPILYYTVR
jgi:hypothetical protein